MREAYAEIETNEFGAVHTHERASGERAGKENT